LLLEPVAIEDGPRGDVLGDDAGLDLLQLAGVESLVDDRAECLAGVAVAARLTHQAVADLADPVVDAQRDPADGDRRLSGAQDPFEAPVHAAA